MNKVTGFIPLVVGVLVLATAMAMLFPRHHDEATAVATPTPHDILAPTPTPWPTPIGSFHTTTIQTLPYSAFESRIKSVGGSLNDVVDWLNSFNPLPCYHDAYWEYRQHVTGIVFNVREYVDSPVNIDHILSLAHCTVYVAPDYTESEVPDEFDEEGEPIE